MFSTVTEMFKVSLNFKVSFNNLSPKSYKTIFGSIEKIYGKENVTYLPGVSYKKGGSFYDMVENDIQLVVDAAQTHDYILLCLGENSYTEKPGDLNDLNLHRLQLKLANAVPPKFPGKYIFRIADILDSISEINLGLPIFKTRMIGFPH